MVDNTELKILLSKLDKRKILYANHSLSNELVYTQEELRTKIIDDIGRAYFNVRESVIAKLKHTGKSSFQAALIRKDGSVLPLQIQATMTEYEQEQLIFASIQPLIGDS